MPAMTRTRTLFIVVLLAALVYNVGQALAVIIEYLRTSDSPRTGFFQFMFWFVWLPVAVLAAWSGLRGGYLALRNANLESGHLTVFAVLMCVIIRVEGVTMAWSAFRLSLYVGLKPLAVGCNFLGVAFAVWLHKLRDVERQLLVKTEHPITGADSSRS